MSNPVSTEKKRKRHSSDKDPRPTKKSATNLEKQQQTQSNGTSDENTIKITHVSSQKCAVPVIASTPGLSVPSYLPLKAFSKGKELLLHSTKHPRLTYLGREQQEGGIDTRLKHYIGIFDPATKEIKLVEAKKVAIRSTVRSEEQSVEMERKGQEETGMSLRQKLGMEFGTKKAKKAIASIQDNMIKTADIAQLDTLEKVQSAIKADSKASAVLESMAASAASAPDKVAMKKLVDDAKPRPKHNPDAKTPEEAYPIKQLIGEDMMREVKVKQWFDIIEEGGAITLQSQFVRRRLVSLIKQEDVGKVKLLRYLEVVIQFLNACKPTRSGKKLPPRDELKSKVDIDPAVLDKIRIRFSRNGRELAKWDMDNVTTHMVVLSLIIDDFETDTWDLKEDLHIDQRKMNQYCKEVGARLTSMTDIQGYKVKLSKEEVKGRKIARLKLPLDFPKHRVMPKQRGR